MSNRVSSFELFEMIARPTSTGSVDRTKHRCRMVMQIWVTRDPFHACLVFRMTSLGVAGCFPVYAMAVAWMVAVVNKEMTMKRRVSKIHCGMLSPSTCARRLKRSVTRLQMGLEKNNMERLSPKRRREEEEDTRVRMRMGRMRFGFRKGILRASHRIVEVPGNLHGFAIVAGKQLTSPSLSLPCVKC